MEVLLSKGLKEEVNYVKDVIKNYANKKEKLILLMPERYHYEGLKLILKESGKESISNIEVLSFNRFYHRIFEEANCFKKELSYDDKEEIINEVITNYLKDHEDTKLHIDANSIAAYSFEVLKLIKLIDEEEFSIEEIDNEELKHIINIYYDSFMEGDEYNFYPSLICAAKNEIEKNKKHPEEICLNKYLQDTQIISFMSYDYTNAQIELFNLIEQFSNTLHVEIMIPYNYEKNFEEYKSYVEYDSYFYVRKLIEKIKAIDSNVNVRELDSKYNTSMSKEAYSNSINTIFEEVYELAYNIKKNFKNEMRPCDIRILVCDLNSYMTQIESIFNTLEIPYHFDKEYNLTNSKLISAYSRMLNFISKDFDTVEIFKFLKCGLAIIKKRVSKYEEGEKINVKKFNSAIKKLEKELINNKKATKFNAWMSDDSFCSELFTCEEISDEDNEIVKSIKERNNEYVDINNVIKEHIKDIYDIYNSEDNTNKYIKLLEKIYDIFYLEKNEIIYQDKLESLVKENLIDSKDAKQNRNILSDLTFNTTSRSTKKFHDEILIEDFDNNTILEANNVYVLGLSDREFKVSRRQNLIDEENKMNEYYAYKYSMNNAFIENTLKLNDGFIVASFINTIGKEQDKLEVNERFKNVYGITDLYLTNIDDKLKLIDLDNSEEVILLLQKENLLTDYNLIDKGKKIIANSFKNNKNILDQIKNIFYHNKNELFADIKYQVGEEEKTVCGTVLKLDLKDKDKPVKTSYSAIDTYVECQYKYALERIAHIDKLDINAIENTTFGTLIHKIFELVFRNYGEKEEDYVFDKANNELTAEKVYEILKKDTFKKEENEKEKYKDRLEFLFDDKYYEGYLKGVIKSILVNINFVIDETNSTNFKDIHNEVKIDMESKNFTMEGYIDRLDSVTKDGKTVYRIFDYKTGAAPSVDFELFSHMQLYIYAMILQKKYKENKANLTDEDIKLDDIENIASLGYIHLVGTPIEVTKERYKLDGTEYKVNHFITDYKFNNKFVYDSLDITEFENAFNNNTDASNIELPKPKKTNIDIGYGDIKNWKDYSATDISSVNDNVLDFNKLIVQNKTTSAKNYNIITKDDSLVNPYTKNGKIEEGFTYKSIDKIAQGMKSGIYNAIPTLSVKPCSYCPYKNLCEFFDVNSKMDNLSGDELKSYRQMNVKEADLKFDSYLDNIDRLNNQMENGVKVSNALKAKEEEKKKAEKEAQKAKEKEEKKKAKE